MTKPNINAPVFANVEVREIFTQILDTQQFTQLPEVLCVGAPTWVIKTGISPRDQDQVAIRLRYSAEPEQLLEQVEQQVDMTQRLRQAGGRVVEFLDNAWLERGQRGTPGGYVASISRYLPGKANSWQYGAAIATLHNASRRLDLSAYDNMDPLVSISNTQAALNHLKDLHIQGKTFGIGGVDIGVSDIDNMDRAFGEATQLRYRLFEAAHANGSPLVVVQEDVQSDNIGQSYDGIGTLLDVDPLVGPAAMDFGRVEDNWLRFAESNDGAAKRDAYRDGYKDYIIGAQLPPENERQLAREYAHRRTPVLMATLAINAVRHGQKGDTWQLKEALYRLRTLDQPDAPWHSDDNARRMRDRT